MRIIAIKYRYMINMYHKIFNEINTDPTIVISPHYGGFNIMTFSSQFYNNYAIIKFNNTTHSYVIIWYNKYTQNTIACYYIDKLNDIDHRIVDIIIRIMKQ